ncbi:MAG TPA: N-acetyltransferase [Candidatus Hydrogenedentes bacterium]|nr:N-acetyltransferase [Candidatus Hydrogenedentota bacterium]HIJ73723.1 N-acetyltransferase [Candidatus Hydrogenedentota bacterium]
MLAVRPEQPDDASAIRQVLEKAFPTHDEARLVDVLRERNKMVLSLVALIDDTIVGHILFTRMTMAPEQPSFEALGLAPLAVLPEYQRKGTGSRLVRDGLVQCRQLGADAVFVLGGPGYYARFGFAAAAPYGILNEYNEPEAFMVIELKKGVLARVNGTAKYLPEFSELDV